MRKKKKQYSLLKGICLVAGHFTQARGRDTMNLNLLFHNIKSGLVVV